MHLPRNPIFGISIFGRTPAPRILDYAYLAILCDGGQIRKITESLVRIFFYGFCIFGINTLSVRNPAMLLRED